MGKIIVRNRQQIYHRCTALVAYRVTQQKGTHSQLHSNVTRSKINIFERLKEQKNRAVFLSLQNINFCYGM